MPYDTPVATYRLQLRDGVDFDRARELLPWLVELGVSHLYLSPPFHAAQGSTHGYDVIDPTCIDPVLGGDEAFVRLSDAARLAGIGIVVDIVPNHMGFTPENPFLADILRNGRASDYAKVFDIDWDKGSIHFPVLDGTPVELLEAGQIAIAGDAQNPLLTVYEREYPLRRTELSAYVAGVSRHLDAATLDTLLAEQHWSLGHWRTSVSRIVHRRFFNITDLIGVRQEDPDVFALTHRWIFDQIEAGRIQGLRVDHVDGLARPGGYLHHLREAVGDTPVWIEKIVKAGEKIPAAWPIAGMSGYEFLAPVTRLLTAPQGLAAMREAAAGAVPDDTALEVRKVRRELLDGVFAPELARVAHAAQVAMASQDRESIAAHVVQMALAWPVYRSYTADLVPLGDVPGDIADNPLLDLLRAPDDPLARAFAARFEQLTGALTAKSEEDTVFYRSVAFLPLCEVGCEPDLEPIDAARFTEELMLRANTTPMALDTLSTHDTKRSADARAVLVALTYFPDLARTLYEQARRDAQAAGLPERWGLYALQTALMLRDEPDADQRMAAHVAKAMREGKEQSSHEAPDEAIEAKVAALAGRFRGELAAGLIPPQVRESFEATVHTIVLAQVALHLAAPGIPDIYQGTEVPAPALTDPDNRRPVDWAAISASDNPKLALTRELLARRAAAPRLFAEGGFKLIETEEGWRIEREWQEQRFTLDVPRPRIWQGLDGPLQSRESSSAETLM